MQLLHQRLCRNGGDKRKQKKTNKAKGTREGGGGEEGSPITGQLCCYEQSEIEAQLLCQKGIFGAIAAPTLVTWEETKQNKKNKTT